MTVGRPTPSDSAARRSCSRHNKPASRGTRLSSDSCGQFEHYDSRPVLLVFGSPSSSTCLARDHRLTRGLDDMKGRDARVRAAAPPAPRPPMRRRATWLPDRRPSIDCAARLDGGGRPGLRPRPPAYSNDVSAASQAHPAHSRPARRLASSSEAEAKRSGACFSQLWRAQSVSPKSPPVSEQMRTSRRAEKLAKRNRAM